MGFIAQMAVMKLPTVLKLVQRMSAGRRALEVVKRVATQVYASATAELTPAELEQLNAILGHIDANLDGSLKTMKRGRGQRGISSDA